MLTKYLRKNHPKKNRQQARSKVHLSVQSRLEAQEG